MSKAVLEVDELVPMFVDAPEVTPGSDPRRVAYTPVSTLIVDPTFQRGVQPQALEAMGELSWGKFEVITVVIRTDGTWIVTEGQHRTLKLRKEFPDAWTWVVIAPTSDEAGLALAISKGRRSYTTFDTFKSRLAQGCELEARADAVMATLGLHLAQVGGGTGSGIAAVGTVMRIMRKAETPIQGAELLDSTLSLLTGLWNVHEQKRLDGHMIGVVSRILMRNDNIRLSELATALQQQTPKRWLQEGDGRLAGETVDAAIGRAILAAYNKGKAENSPRRIRW